MTPCRLVLVTAPPKKAEALAKGLVAARLAACVNVVPGIISRYRWEGKLHRDKESLLLIKTRASLLKKVAAWVMKNHPYAVPEVLALPVAGGSKPYLSWLAAQTR
jgi:periplasmic divalent cation tolerance protein